jgi:hypothetical protein
MLAMLRRRESLRAAGTTPKCTSEAAQPTPFRMLHLAVAPLIVAVASVAWSRASSPTVQPQSGLPERSSAASRWGPALLAPAAALTHLTYAIHPTPAVRATLAAFNAGVLGTGMIGLIGASLHPRGAGDAAAAAAFGLTGVAGLLLDAQEAHASAELFASRTREPGYVRFFERVTAPRRPRIHRIVIHV